MVVENAEFETLRKGFTRKLKNRFVMKHETEAEQHLALGLGRQSTRKDVDLVTDNADKVITTDARQMSRYHWEDMIRMQEGDSMFLYFRKDKLVLHDLFGSMPTDAHKVQLGSNLVEANTRLGGIDFVQVKATINLATTHREACAGTTSIEQLKIQFHTRQGYFVVNLCGTHLNLNFSWKEVATAT